MRVPELRTLLWKLVREQGIVVEERVLRRIEVLYRRLVLWAMQNAPADILSGSTKNT